MAEQQTTPKDKDMQLKITSCAPVYSGKNARDDDYTIYEVKAEKPDGTSITEPLRSFAALPVGQLIEVTVKAFNSEQYGRSFTIFAKNRTASSTQAMNDLTELVQSLAGRVAELERKAGMTATQERRDEQFGVDPPY